MICQGIRDQRRLLALALVLLPHGNLCVWLNAPAEAPWLISRAGVRLLGPRRCHQQFLRQASRWLPKGTGFGRFGPRSLEAEFGGRKPRIVIASFFQSTENASDAFKDIISNHEAYAAKHGYGFFAPVVHTDSKEARRWTHGRGAGWAKIKILEFLMGVNGTGNVAQPADYVFWSDADSIILNDSIRLEDFAELGRDLVLGTDVNGICTGHMLLRNSDWSRQLLRQAWQHCPPQTFLFEQEGIAVAASGGNWRLLLPGLVHKVLGAQMDRPEKAHNAWKALPAESQKHVYITGQCALNAGCTTDILHRDDFIYHTAGGSLNLGKYQHLNGLSKSLREHPLLHLSAIGEERLFPDFDELRQRCYA